MTVRKPGTSACQLNCRIAREGIYVGVIAVKIIVHGKIRAVYGKWINEVYNEENSCLLFIFFWRK